MAISLYPPLALNELGRAEINQDYIYPKKGLAHPNDNLYIVCDGMGGEPYGEIASKMACDSMVDFFNNNEVAMVDEKYLTGAFENTQALFDFHIKANPSHRGMGTTTVILTIRKEGVVIAHCGDSRAYHIRAGKIIGKTFDHKLGKELFRLGKLNSDEAKRHPFRNVLSRCIQGNILNPTKIEVAIINDVKAGDYFFLCSDGIYEELKDEYLVNILGEDSSNLEKINLINETCTDAWDNYSCYLIQVEGTK